jgi:hypothetical protein
MGKRLLGGRADGFGNTANLFSGCLASVVIGLLAMAAVLLAVKKAAEVALVALTGRAGTRASTHIGPRRRLGRLQGPHPVVSRIVLELGEAQGLHQRGDVDAKASAKALL